MSTKRPSENAPERPSKRQKKVKTLQEKVEILDMLGKANSIAAVARHYGINESTVRSIKKKEFEIRSAVAAATPAGAKTLHQLRDPIVSRAESAVFLWAQDCYKKGIPVDSVMIKEKAKSLYNSIKERDGEKTNSADFHASKGWFHNFKKRFGLFNVNAAGERAFVDQKAANEFPEALRELIADKLYSPEQVFNVDETLLFWKKIPRRTFANKEEKRAACFKTGQDRLTMLFCANASGHMIKPTMIYKNANPRELKGKDKSQLPVHWMPNKKAWITQALFLDWFRRHFVPEVGRYLAGMGMPFKVLLILNNTPGHPNVNEFKTDGVEVLYVPPNATSTIQPLDRGAIQTFKAHYTRHLMEKIVEATEEDPSTENVMQTWKDYNIVDAIGNVDRAAKAIKMETINSCWKNLWPQCVRELTPVSAEPINGIVKDIVELTRKLSGERFNDMDIKEIEELVDIKPGVLTEDDLMELTVPEVKVKLDEEDQEEVQDKFTLNNIAAGLRKFKSAMDHFCDIDPSMVRSLQVKELVEDALSTYADIFNEMKEQKRQTGITMYFQKATAGIPSTSAAPEASPCSSTSTVFIKRRSSRTSTIHFRSFRSKRSTATIRFRINNDSAAGVLKRTRFTT